MGSFVLGKSEMFRSPGSDTERNPRYKFSWIPPRTPFVSKSSDIHFSGLHLACNLQPWGARVSSTASRLRGVCFDTSKITTCGTFLSS